mgnify:CR=1 FL=1
MSVTDAHDICDRLERALKAAVQDALITIHVEPDNKAKHAGIVTPQVIHMHREQVLIERQRLFSSVANLEDQALQIRAAVFADSILRDVRELARRQAHERGLQPPVGVTAPPVDVARPTMPVRPAKLRLEPLPRREVTAQHRLVGHQHRHRRDLVGEEGSEAFGNLGQLVDQRVDGGVHVGLDRLEYAVGQGLCAGPAVTEVGGWEGGDALLGDEFDEQFDLGIGVGGEEQPSADVEHHAGSARDKRARRRYAGAAEAEDRDPLAGERGDANHGQIYRGSPDPAASSAALGWRDPQAPAPPR